MGRLNLLGGQSNLLGGQMPTQLNCYLPPWMVPCILCSFKLQFLRTQSVYRRRKALTNVIIDQCLRQSVAV